MLRANQATTSGQLTKPVLVTPKEAAVRFPQAEQGDAKKGLSLPNCILSLNTEWYLGGKQKENTNQQAMACTLKIKPWQGRKEKGWQGSAVL